MRTKIGRNKHMVTKTNESNVNCQNINTEHMEQTNKMATKEASTESQSIRLNVKTHNEEKITLMKSIATTA